MRRACALALLLLPSVARGWDPATTHAGLTEQAARASSLGAKLRDLLGLPRGLDEVLAFQPRDARGADLASRLARLDPAGGYAPDPSGGRLRLPAMGWLMAGSVVEETPPERGRNHFFDPATRRGLTDGDAVARFGRRLDAAAVGLANARDVLDGRAFDGTGRPSIEWLVADANDLGLPRFLDARERAVLAPSTAERQAALAEALLVAGALLHVVEDAGDPAHAHADFAVDLFDRGAPFARWVAERFGRQAVPAPRGLVRDVARLADLISAPDGEGLADRTARRFFSLGVLAGAIAPVPGMPPLVAGAADRGYAYDAERRHLARWTRDGDGLVRWDLDERCFADYAAALLPETAGAAESALEHLFRGGLVLDGSGARNGPLALGAGRATLVLEDERGARRVAAVRDLPSLPAGEPLLALPPTVEGAKRVAVVFRGVDGHGDPIVLSVESAVPFGR